MTQSIKTLGARAFDNMAKQFDKLIFDGRISKTIEGTYNTETGSYELVELESYPFRFLIDSKAKKDGKLGSYETAPDELVIFCQGFTVQPKIGMSIQYDDIGFPTFDNDFGTFDSDIETNDEDFMTKTVTFVSSVMGTGDLYYLVVK